jgi:hypothetical protein
MNNTAARVSGNEKEKRKKTQHVSGEGLQENALIVFSHKRYNV